MPRRPGLPVFILAVALQSTVAWTAGTAAQPDTRPDVWDLALGSPVAVLPVRFVDYACGTSGGPPSRLLRGFNEFALCPADARGLREVYFRYDDEMEYIARALEQPALIARFAGTKVFGYPVVASALFDDAGRLRGIRLVTDPRGVTPDERSDFWTLGTVLRNYFGADGWTCADLPLEAGEEPVGAFLIKTSCGKSDDGLDFRIEQRYLRRRGHAFIDELTGTVVPGAFESATIFEMFLADPASGGG